MLATAHVTVFMPGARRSVLFAGMRCCSSCGARRRASSRPSPAPAQDTGSPPITPADVERAAGRCRNDQLNATSPPPAAAQPARGTEQAPAASAHARR